MRIGVVTKWFNRGQPVVGRHTRSALDSLGHETFVLARPKKERGPQPGALSRDDVWDQAGVTEASEYDIPLADYTEWIERQGIEAILCDQNYGFSELAELRSQGVKVIGRFVWEHFTAEHVEGARSAYDVVFSMTRAEQDRYREMGLETPYVPWGCHPELIEVAEAVAREPSDTVTFIFTGGFLGHRKPLEPVLEAWSLVRSQRARLSSRRRSSVRGSRKRKLPRRRTRGSSCGSPTSRPADTSRRWRRPTSRSRPRGGRASGFRSTRPSRSASPRSPTTSRR